MSLKASAVLFAVLWTAGMLWWNAPLDAAKVVIWLVAGALTGILWYWAMKFWMDRRRRP